MYELLLITNAYVLAYATVRYSKTCITHKHNLRIDWKCGNKLICLRWKYHKMDLFSLKYMNTWLVSNSAIVLQFTYNQGWWFWFPCWNGRCKHTNNIILKTVVLVVAKFGSHEKTGKHCSLIIMITLDINLLPVHSMKYMCHFALIRYWLVYLKRRKMYSHFDTVYFCSASLFTFLLTRFRCFSCGRSRTLLRDLSLNIISFSMQIEFLWIHNLVLVSVVWGLHVFVLK